jgi:hypothetical protein
VEFFPALEEVEAEHIVPQPTLHMPQTASNPSTGKVVIENLRLVLHVLDEPLHQIPSESIVDMML